MKKPHIALAALLMAVSVPGCSTTSKTPSPTPTAAPTATPCAQARVWFTWPASSGFRRLLVDGVQIDMKPPGVQTCYGYVFLFSMGTVHTWEVDEDPNSSGVWNYLIGGAFTVSCPEVKLGPGC